MFIDTLKSFLFSVFRTPTLVKAQTKLGFTGGGRSALYWGRTCGALLGCAESHFEFCILHFAFLSSLVSRLSSELLPLSRRNYYGGAVCDCFMATGFKPLMAALT